MFCQFSSFLKRFFVISRHQRCCNNIIRHFVCISTGCNILEVISVSARKDCAEFGRRAEQQLSSSFCITSVTRSFHTTSKTCKMGSIDDVSDVDVDPNGKFKYILVEIEKAGKKKKIVRGYNLGTNSGEDYYHADIYEQVCSQLEPQSFTCECLGGGRIEHKSKEETLLVYGYSVGFGKANHEITVEKLKARYPSYKKITFSDGGY